MAIKLTFLRNWIRHILLICTLPRRISNKAARSLSLPYKSAYRADFWEIVPGFQCWNVIRASLWPVDQISQKSALSLILYCKNLSLSASWLLRNCTRNSILNIDSCITLTFESNFSRVSSVSQIVLQTSQRADFWEIITRCTIPIRASPWSLISGCNNGRRTLLQLHSL